MIFKSNLYTHNYMNTYIYIFTTYTVVFFTLGRLAVLKFDGLSLFPLLFDGPVEEG